MARLVDNAHRILDEAISRTEADRRTVAGIVILFSGGNDSTVLTHLFKGRANYAAHANTGIGIEQTRQFVRDTCASWGLPLMERYPEPGSGYRDLVLGRVTAKTGLNRGQLIWPGGGFPGPASHWLMYQRLKERSLEQVRRQLVKNPYRERVLFLAGRRGHESARRRALLNRHPIERRGSTVWVSPLLEWTKLDLNTYRFLHPDVPRNVVSDLLHMSGECLCGAFAHRGELDEIGQWFPDVRAEIEALEREVSSAGIAAPERCRWGWGATRERRSAVGPLCSSCDERFTGPSTGPAETA